MNKYESLYDYLMLAKINRISLSFQEIENIIDSKLPPTAYKNSAWWSNDDKTHTQSSSWSDAGYSSSKVNLKTKTIIFVKHDFKMHRNYWIFQWNPDKPGNEQLEDIIVNQDKFGWTLNQYKNEIN